MEWGRSVRQWKHRKGSYRESPAAARVRVVELRGVFRELGPISQADDVCGCWQGALQIALEDVSKISSAAEHESDSSMMRVGPYIQFNHGTS